ncbi:MAG: methyltransferase domain-containing protein [Acidobacteria bacterium]|nr:methyltransferase domain-containing protein [Acidobacteriota bacterium]
MTPQQLQQQIAALGPWFYPFDLGNGLRTESQIPPEVTGIFETRLQMVEQVVENHFGSRLQEISCLDLGCHEGFYSIAMARKGVPQVLGVDVRESNLRKARFVAQTLGLPQIQFRQANIERLRSEEVGRHELTLFLGVLYHLENPMLCLRNLSQITKELCVVETQVIEEVEGETEWGSRQWTRPYQGVLAVIDESGEFYADNSETGSTPVALCPSPKALTFLLKQAGFARVEIVPPPPAAYEQHARAQRLVCAAYK